MRAAGLIFALLVAAIAAPAVAHEVTLPAEERTRPYSGILPACDHPEVLSTIRARFQQRESGYWSSDLTIADIDRVRVTGKGPGVAISSRAGSARRAPLSAMAGGTSLCTPSSRMGG